MLSCFLIVCLLIITSFINKQAVPVSQVNVANGQSTGSPPPHKEEVTKNTPPKREVVDVFGGSMAYGWKDPRNISYLQRAFESRSKTTSVQYKYINHAIPGFTAEWLNQRYPGKFEAWLKADHPQIVILSWGLENDMSSVHKDSLPIFSKQIREEVSMALAHHAVVLIITPPVTKLLATKDRSKVLSYIHTEFEVGKSFHSPNVLTIRLFHQFKTYMWDHHQTYKPYFGNAWHPNRAGHKLGGILLAADLEKRFGKGPIEFKEQNSHSSKKGLNLNLIIFRTH